MTDSQKKGTGMEITTPKEDEEDTLIDMNQKVVLERLSETVGTSKPERRYFVRENRFQPS